MESASTRQARGRLFRRVAGRGGVVWYESNLLAERGLRHGFSTRLGGVSGGAFANLNLAAAGAAPAPGAAQDLAENVAENRRRFLHALGCGDCRWTAVRQVHGADVAVIEPSAPVAGVCADAMVTDQPNVALAIRVADCVPVLLAAVRDAAVVGVAAVHAGWRGVVAGVVPAAVRRLTQMTQAQPRDLLAAIGPCVSLAYFEVGDEVAQAFATAGLAGAVSHAVGPKPHVDLAQAVDQQLLAAGLPQAAIDRTDRCTFRDAEEFFSHRRDAGMTGRMAAVIALAN